MFRRHRLERESPQLQTIELFHSDAGSVLLIVRWVDWIDIKARNSSIAIWASPAFIRAAGVVIPTHTSEFGSCVD